MHRIYARMDSNLITALDRIQNSDSITATTDALLHFQSQHSGERAPFHVVIQAYQLRIAYFFTLDRLELERRIRRARLT
jgi:hypothetical protein